MSVLFHLSLLTYVQGMEMVYARYGLIQGWDRIQIRPWEVLLFNIVLDCGHAQLECNVSELIVLLLKSAGNAYILWVSRASVHLYPVQMFPFRGKNSLKPSLGASAIYNKISGRDVSQIQNWIITDLPKLTMLMVASPAKYHHMTQVTNDRWSLTVQK